MDAIIHATAVVHPKAQLGKNVQIGPYCIVGPYARLGDGVVLRSHVVIDTHAVIGPRCEFFPFVSLNKPQDLKFHDEPSWVEIGSDTVLREYVTIQPGTEGDKMKTTVGSHCFLMAHTHVAHDCSVGNHVIMANHATLAGHVTVEDYVIIGGLAAVHQFVTIGKYAMIGGLSPVEHDVLPFSKVKCDPGYLNGLNIIGMKRNGFGREQIDLARRLYQQIFAQDGNLADRVESLVAEYQGDELAAILLDFIKRSEKRAMVFPKRASLAVAE